MLVLRVIKTAPLVLQVVAGLDEALLSMQTGGVRRVYVPGALAFPKGLPSGPGRRAYMLSEMLCSASAVSSVRLIFVTVVNPCPAPHASPVRASSMLAD